MYFDDTIFGKDDNMPKVSTLKRSKTAQPPEPNIRAMKHDEIIGNIAKMKPKEKLELLEEIGVGSDFFTCYICGKPRKSSEFYTCSDPNCKSGKSRICKYCAEDFAYSVNGDGKKHEPTKESIMIALEYLDKPFLDKVFDSSLLGAQAGKKSDVWVSYINSICTNSSAKLKRWRDGDVFQGEVDTSEKIENTLPVVNAKDIMESYEQNRKDVIRLVGYDPFARYPTEEDKPILYSQLVNFLDEETKNDGMKLAAAIQIVKRLNQAEKLNDQIDYMLSDPNKSITNQAVVNKMMDTAQKNMKIANDLAKDNGISVNFNNNKSKGANTLAGKMKDLKEKGLRSAEINTFDIGTCEGMRQVAEISEEARHKQIGYDENIAKEIRDIKVELVESMTRERDEANERARKLLVENRDLKDYMVEKGLMNEKYEVIE